MVEEIEAWFGFDLKMVDIGCWSELVGEELGERFRGIHVALGKGECIAPSRAPFCFSPSEASPTAPSTVSFYDV